MDIEEGELTLEEMLGVAGARKEFLNRTWKMIRNKVVGVLLDDDIPFTYNGIGTPESIECNGGKVSMKIRPNVSPVLFLCDAFGATLYKWKPTGVDTAAQIKEVEKGIGTILEYFAHYPCVENVALRIIDMARNMHDDVLRYTACRPVCGPPAADTNDYVTCGNLSIAVKLEDNGTGSITVAEKGEKDALPIPFSRSGKSLYDAMHYAAVTVSEIIVRKFDEA